MGHFSRHDSLFFSLRGGNGESGKFLLPVPSLRGQKARRGGGYRLHLLCRNFGLRYLKAHILRDPQTHALHVFFTKAGIVYFPRLETEPNLQVIDFIRPVVQVARGEVWVGPTRGFDLTTRIRLTAIVVRGVSVPAGWKESSSARASHHGPVFR